MGSLDVKVINTQKQLSEFTRCLLRDVHLLDRMLKEDWFNKEPLHIGAEQEVCLIDTHQKPSKKALKILEKLNHPDFTTELALFNLECNLQPHPFTGNCLSDLEQEIVQNLALLAEKCKEENIDYILTGILPTLRKFDLDISNITPLKRYEALATALARLRGKQYEFKLSGYEDLHVKFNSVMPEACNTSFQVHLQVDPDEFVEQYNVAQMIAAPVLAIAANSPLLFGKKLWHETRIGLFEQSVDTRITSEHLREKSPRVMFGNHWLKNSVVELFKEDISRFRVMLMTTATDQCQHDFDDGVTPKLNALNIHNSTVYRWNRACYGISPNGKPHLRIENRIIPSGPTPQDEVANAAFWLGMMTSFPKHYPNLTDDIPFEHVRSNFYNAARNSLSAKMRWFDGKRHAISDLIRDVFLPLAEEGLKARNISDKDIDKYLNIIRGRLENNQNGSYWTLRSFQSLANEASKEEIILALTSSMKKHMNSDKPVHEWPLADLSMLQKIHPESMLVEEFMTTDLFTVQKDDIIELVADMMDWQHIRFTPVEDSRGNLVGLISERMVLRHFRNKERNAKSHTLVSDIMMPSPITIRPDQTIWEAIRLMKKEKVSCLPVVSDKQLIGIVSEGDFLGITSALLNIFKQQEKSKE